jgi:hypothetical protein
MPMDLYFEMFYARDTYGTEQFAYYMLHEYLEANGVSHAEIAARESQEVRGQNVRSLARVHAMNQILWYMKVGTMNGDESDTREKETTRTAINKILETVDNDTDRRELEKLAFTLFNVTPDAYLPGSLDVAPAQSNCHLLINVDVFEDPIVFDTNMAGIKQLVSKGLVQVKFTGTKKDFLDRVKETFGFTVVDNDQLKEFLNEFDVTSQAGEQAALGIVSEKFDFVYQTTLPKGVVLIPVKAESFIPKIGDDGVMKVLSLDVIAVRFVKYGVEGLNTQGRMDMLHFGTPLLLRDTLMQAQVSKEYKLAA